MQTKWLQTKRHIPSGFILAGFILLFTSCSGRQIRPVIIWTDNPEFVSYVELFNSTHKDAKAAVVYKESVASALPPTKDELQPDLVIGSWLKNSSTRKYFSPVDYMLSEQGIVSSAYYKQLIEYGQINEKQYLLPVSFNIPAIIYSKKNESLVSQSSSHLLNLEQIKTIAAAFNEKNKDGVYTAMGFAPSWDTDFMYELTKLYDVSYREKGSSFVWDQKAMQNAVSDMREWTLARNTDTASEQNFQFKYLYMPKHRQVTTDRCLFAYTTSSELFTLTETQVSPLSFRWLEQNGKIPVEDSIITMGLYKNAKNVSGAEKFIGWFCKEDTQRELILRTESLKLDTINFGIAGGFSAIKSVNEKIYPSHYRQLLGNLPGEDYLVMPKILPYRWENIKQRVIIPYLTESTNTNSEKTVTPLEERISEWTKQYY